MAVCNTQLLSQQPLNSDPDWSVLMQQSDANPDAIRSVFEMQWEGRERTKGSGYKQVERWLHLMEGRTDAEGVVLGSRGQRYNVQRPSWVLAIIVRR